MKLFYQSFNILFGFLQISSILIFKNSSKILVFMGLKYSCNGLISKFITLFPNSS